MCECMCVFCCCCSIGFLLQRHTVCVRLWITHLLRAFFLFEGKLTFVSVSLGIKNGSSKENQHFLSVELWPRQPYLLEKYTPVFHLGNSFLGQFQPGDISRDVQAPAWGGLRQKWWKIPLHTLWSALHKQWGCLSCTCVPSGHVFSSTADHMVPEDRMALPWAHTLFAH